MTFRNAFAAMLLAVAAAATWYWSRPPVSAPEPRSAADRAPLGYYLRGARIIGTDNSGRITYTLTAERLEDLPGEEQLELTDVTIEYRPESDVSWEVRAARATASKSGRADLELGGNVELRNEPAAGRPATIVTAESLRLSPDEFLAESAAPVEVRIGNDVLRAGSLRVDLKEDHLQLESAGHGRFVP